MRPRSPEQKTHDDVLADLLDQGTEPDDAADAAEDAADGYGDWKLDQRDLD